MLLNDGSIPQAFTSETFGLSLLQQQYLGIYSQQPCFAVEVSNEMPPDGMHFMPLKQCYEHIREEDLLSLACRAKQILLWDKSTQYCGYCGHKTLLSSKERAKSCDYCNAVFFPQISPVIIVLISHKDKLLLARSPHFSTGVYSTLAGFVESGETAEDAVVREVFEEVSIKVKNIRYFGSQSWPFPSNLMLAYTAEYESGEIKVDGIEIEDAKWFSVNNLPSLPKKASIAWRMIEHFSTNISSKPKANG